MKIIIVGASGTIGKPVSDELSKRHEVIRVGSKSGDIQMDMTSVDSIQKMYEAVGEFDALVVAAGSATMKPLQELANDDFYVGIKSKMMGQVNLVLEGQKRINPKGSFTLITGILADDPVHGSVTLSTVNGAVNAFVKATARELDNGVRINVVSPGLVEESAEALGSYFPGHTPVSMHRMVDGFVKSVEGIGTGEVIRLH